MYRTILLAALLATPARAQLGTAKLEEIGVIQTGSRSLKINGPATSVNLVIKLVPNVGSGSSCLKPAIDQYLALIGNVVGPLEDALNASKSRFTFTTANSPTRNESTPRFFGIAVGMAAFGVATGAAITSGIALHRSNRNAQDIASLKSAILSSNAAIQSLTDAQGKTVVAIQGVQDHINTAIIPAITELGCDVAKNTLGIALTQYYSQLTFVFGPNLANPIDQPVTVQAIAQLFEGDFTRIMTEFGYASADVLDLLATNSILGNIISVDKASGLLVLEVTFPQFIGIDNTAIVELDSITFNQGGSEWQTEIPKSIAVRNTLVSGVSTEGCILTQTSMLCKTDPTYALSAEMVACLKGSVSSCPRIRILSTFAQRFAVNRGFVIANCVSASCLCGDPGRPVVQSIGQTLTPLSINDCKLVTVDGIQILMPRATRNVSADFGNITVGPPITVDPIDLSAELAGIKKDLEAAQEALDQSNEILSRINPDIINSDTMVIAIVLGSFATALAIILLILIVRLWVIMRAVKRSQKSLLSKSVGSLGPMNYS